MKKNNLNLTTVTDLTEEFNYSETKHRLLIIADFTYFFNRETFNTFDGSFVWADSDFIKQYNQILNNYFKKKNTYNYNRNLKMKESVCFGYNIEVIFIKEDDVNYNQMNQTNLNNVNQIVDIKNNKVKSLNIEDDFFVISNLDDDLLN